MLMCPNVDKSCYVKSGDIIYGDKQGYDLFQGSTHVLNTKISEQNIFFRNEQECKLKKNIIFSFLFLFFFLDLTTD